MLVSFTPPLYSADAFVAGTAGGTRPTTPNGFQWRHQNCSPCLWSWGPKLRMTCLLRATSRCYGAVGWLVLRCAPTIICGCHCGQMPAAMNPCNTSTLHAHCCCRLALDMWTLDIVRLILAAGSPAASLFRGQTALQYLFDGSEGWNVGCLIRFLTSRPDAELRLC